MRLLDQSFSAPAENLAADEVLLESAEQGCIPCSLRFWESPSFFVVIGSGQHHGKAVHSFNCLRDGVPILRRCSAGGAVLQGPGCLNFALALSYERFPEVSDLQGSYRHILDRVIEALSGIGIAAVRAGVSDLACNGLKISGNAQRRRRHACLHHGTLLYEVEWERMHRYLPEPQDRPEYRGGRTHAEFVGAVRATSQQLRMALVQTFCPDAPPGEWSQEEKEQIAFLAQTKYRENKWNLRR